MRAICPSQIEFAPLGGSVARVQLEEKTEQVVLCALPVAEGGGGLILTIVGDGLGSFVHQLSLEGVLEAIENERKPGGFAQVAQLVPAFVDGYFSRQQFTAHFDGLLMEEELGAAQEERNKKHDGGGEQANVGAVLIPEARNQFMDAPGAKFHGQGWGFGRGLGRIVRTVAVGIGGVGIGLSDAAGGSLGLPRAPR